jgi:hypothetical protein
MATIFSKIIKGILVGGGTVLSMISPPVGGAVMSVGMSIGQGAVAAGSLINKGSGNTVDKTVSTINDKLSKLGLLDPAATINTPGGKSATFVLSPILLITLGFLFIVLIFKRR